MRTAAPRERDKHTAAMTSLIAAIGLTTFKILVGWTTGSLGILAEAAHSGLDLVAAFVTVVAIRVSARPADRGHPYGHGKVENLSALTEVLLLLITCFWIMERAVHRLRSDTVEVEVTFWSFAVMAASIVIDFSRSRVLRSAAIRHKSQALEADALHFETDIWSSAVVILGLACVKVSEWFPRLAPLRHADAVSAIFVALIIVVVSARLGMRAIHALIDAAPAGLEQRIIQSAEAVPGVLNCHSVRLRHSGPWVFADIHVLMDGSQTLRQAHAVTEAVETAIQSVIPNADIVVHAEPADEGAAESTTQSA